MTENHPKLAKIRRLLALAERAGSEHEAENAMNRARVMMAEYGIDEALANATSEKKETVSTRTIVLEAPYVRDKRTLLNNIYLPLNCQNIQMGNVTADKKIFVQVYGYDSDLDRAEMLYTSLLLQAQRGMMRVPSAGHPRTTAANRRSWLQGFTVEVRDRLRAAEERAAGTVVAPEGVSTALVLRDRKQDVEDAYKAAHPNVFHRQRNLSGKGYEAGREAGRRADLGNGRLGGTRKALA